MTLDVLTKVAPTPDAMMLADAERMRMTAGRALQSGFFPRGEKGQELLVILVELEVRGHRAMLDYDHVFPWLYGGALNDEHKRKKIADSKMVMCRLRGVLDRLAAQAPEDSVIIDIPKVVRVARRSPIHRPKLVSRSTLSDAVLPRSGLFSPVVAVPGAAPISCSAVRVRQDVTLLLSAWPEFRRQDRTPSENLRNDRTAVLWQILGISAPGFDPSCSGAPVSVPADELIASEVAYLTARKGRAEITPIHGEEDSFRWSAAFHIRSAAVATLAPTIDIT
jgi:hypothetical protein